MDELLYTSIASHPMSEDDLMAILDQARARNVQMNVTGLLIYDQQKFMQILEGEKANLETLMASIGKDPRHHSVNIVHTGAIEARSFEGWAMACNFSDEAVEAWESRLKVDEADPHRFAGEPNLGVRLFKLMNAQP